MILSEIVADSPLGYWPLDEASGTVARDVSGNAQHGTYAGGLSRVDGLGWRGQLFNGTTGKMTTPSLTLGTAQPQSFELWHYSATAINSASASTNPIGRSTTADLIGFGAVTTFLANEVTAIANNSAGADDRTGWTSFTIPAGWHHHAWTYSGSQNGWTYYLDGVAIGSKTSNSGGCFGFATGTFLFSAAVSTFYALTLAQAAIFASELSAARVAVHFRAGVRGGVSY